MTHTIELRKVSKYYSDRDTVSMGISRVDLDLDIGEFVVITGESGGGKSTLLNVISGLDSYEEGEMHVCGEDTAAFDSSDYENYRKTYICNIFQDFNLIGSYTVYQNIELMMLINGHTKKECAERVPDIIEEVRLRKYSNTKVSKLSGGQKQRVAIARAVAKEAPILVADEPTGNLDSESAHAVMETLSRVAQDKLVLIVTHNYEQAEPYATRKLTMHDGRIIEDRRICEPKRGDAVAQQGSGAVVQSAEQGAAAGAKADTTDEAANAKADVSSAEGTEADTAAETITAKAGAEAAIAKADAGAEKANAKADAGAETANAKADASAEAANAKADVSSAEGTEADTTAETITANAGAEAAIAKADAGAEKANAKTDVAENASAAQQGSDAVLQSAEQGAAAETANAKKGTASEAAIVKAGAASAVKNAVAEGVKTDTAAETTTAKAAAKEDKKRRSGMLRASELRLGLRNTFNLPVKLVLLLIVYMFASVAVLSQYASTANSIHQNELMGINPYFANTSADRLIVRKNNETPFTAKDLAVISKTENIAGVVPNDIEIDNSVCFDLDDYFIKGTLYPVSHLKDKKLTYGHMPRTDYEIVIHTNSSSGAFLSLANLSDEIIGSEIEMQDSDQKHYYTFDDPLTVAGIIIDDDISEDTEFDLYGDSEIYVSDKISNRVMVLMTAANSETVIDYDGTPVRAAFDQVVFPNPDIEEGEAVITDEQKYYYPNDSATGKKLSINVHNRYFDSDCSLTIKETVKTGNIKEVLGLDKKDYLSYQNCVFVSEKDFAGLFDKGSFQASAFMINETESDKTIAALGEAGYKALAVKDTLTDATGGYSSVIYLMDYGRLAVEFLLLFFITYAVISLIMRSRRSYYSTLRMLGATRKNIFVILGTELIVAMTIAYADVAGAVAYVMYGYKGSSEASALMNFLKPADYAVLAAVLLLMTLLIAARYSRRIFAGSVMKLFREEA